MKKSRYSEEQIIAVLKEHQAGIPVSYGRIWVMRPVRRRADRRASGPQRRR